MKRIQTIVLQVADNRRNLLFKLYKDPTKCVLSNRYISSSVPQIGNAGDERAKMISKAMKMYLEKARTYDSFIENEIAEFEIGKRHLANIMGVDVNNFTQEDIDSAIEYLLPSGLFDKKARPKLKHPLEILPKRKVAQFGNDGRPFNTFFYTVKANLTGVLHDISVKLESVKRYEDEQLSKKIIFDENLKLQLTGSQWLEKKSMDLLLDEVLSENEYKDLLIALEKLTGQTYSYIEKDFIFKFRKVLQIQKLSDLKEIIEKKYDSNNREYLEATGKRKTAEATVKMYTKGSGVFTVNGKPLLNYFPFLIDREQVLYPLHITDTLRTIDFEAQVEFGGVSGQSGALRYTLARALQGLVDSPMVEKLRLAGLLQRDLRTRERKKPGQKGARAKFTWKKR